MKFSVLIMTLNEQKNIASCIKSVQPFSDDIVVLDSISTDDTVAISNQLGARVYNRVFDNYASQRNYGINELKYDNTWLLMLDADEILTEELGEEILKLEPDSNDAIFRFRRKDFFCNKWIKHSSGYPTWFGRLVKIGSVSVQREINEEYHTNGNVRMLQHHIDHFPFNNGVSFWLERHNKYSTMEADRMGESVSVQYTKLFSKDPSDRRACLKSIVYKLPLRPLVVFMIFYIYKLGFLDGVPGLKFSLLKFFYEFMIDLKVEEKGTSL
ncbi:glycosyltransferase family 2 protein [Escherichia coli]|uniref:glycosyltransferase family 2 protein n=1 Tax=Escherichia coli TaxID=562 RepID=UPI000BE69FDF|nr:glycosyltransferase family 2 protein [Escherichia coli]EKE6589311.1 glycosyltransferase family 2 protein [Escherichia coli]MBW1121879.1 glycosyltransferase family 2 protein [Escherichia coli]MDZ8398453.1 glycosyltransferase family 2 protein [Escherichia coli]HAJ3020379.1 glycosyltransferase family 2 protein [Escherichia coli]HCX4675383.1 glycosyltransferase family 2 protein [Escherichia coli]